MDFKDTPASVSKDSMSQSEGLFSTRNAGICTGLRYGIQARLLSLLYLLGATLVLVLFNKILPELVQLWNMTVYSRQLYPRQSWSSCVT